VIGRGSFGKVMLVKKNDTQEPYAMKMLKKEDLLLRNQKLHTKSIFSGEYRKKLSEK